MNRTALSTIRAVSSERECQPPSLSLSLSWYEHLLGRPHLSQSYLQCIGQRRFDLQSDEPRGIQVLNMDLSLRRKLVSFIRTRSATGAIQ